MSCILNVSKSISQKYFFITDTFFKIEYIFNKLKKIFFY